MKAQHEHDSLDNLILLTEVGSDLHGTSVTEQDDIDQMGVFVETPQQRLGLNSKDHDLARWHPDGTAIPDGARSGPGDTDSTLYSLRKFVSLASKGNPTVLMPLFAPKDKVKALDGVGFVLRGVKQSFITRQAGFKFLGYCKGQQQQMIDAAPKHTNRPELISQFGFDTKFAYHALRLAIQGKEMLETGDITLPMAQYQREFIQDVRIGVFSKQTVIAILDDLVNDLEKTAEEFDGPKKMDAELVDSFLREMHLTHWEMKGLI